MRLPILVASILFTAVVKSANDIDNKYLQCLVCRATIKEVIQELSKVDPKRDIEIGNYRLDADGNEIRKKVPMARSEVHISDVLDNICEKLSDYVRATYKSNGKLMVMNLITPSGGMNPEMSNVDIIQDGDLNKSLEYLCEAIMNDHEESIIKILQEGTSDVTDTICTDKTEVCTEYTSTDEKDVEDRTEL